MPLFKTTRMIFSNWRFTGDLYELFKLNKCKIDLQMVIFIRLIIYYVKLCIGTVSIRERTKSLSSAGRLQFILKTKTKKVSIYPEIRFDPSDT
jgi:hypothetical protein